MTMWNRRKIIMNKYLNNLSDSASTASPATPSSPDSATHPTSDLATHPSSDLATHPFPDSATDPSPSIDFSGPASPGSDSSAVVSFVASARSTANATGSTSPGLSTEDSCPNKVVLLGSSMPTRRNYPLSKTYHYPAIMRGVLNREPRPKSPEVMPARTSTKNTLPMVPGRLAYLHTGGCTERPIRDNQTPCFYLDIHTIHDMVHPDLPPVKYIKENRVYNVCGLFNEEIGPPSKEKKKMCKFIHSTGIKYSAITAEFRKIFNSFDKRKKTFDRCRKLSSENIDAICEAGFYYTGNGNTDQTTCFCCGKKVCFVGNSVKPWTTHAIVSNQCHYLALCKGKYYVDKVHNESQWVRDSIEENVMHKHLANVGCDEYSFNEIFTSPNFSDSEDDSSEFPSCKEVATGKFLTERLHLPKKLSEIPESLLCKICSKDIMAVLYIPCGHIITCIQCTLALEHCPLCSKTFNDNTFFLRVFIEIIDEDAERLINQTSLIFEKPKINPVLCKICQKNNMVVYAPCRHLYSCGECTFELKKCCPICSVSILGFIQTSMLS